MSKSSIQQATKVFNIIRDIPYQLNVAQKDTSCSSKAKLLGELLTRLGFTVRNMCCIFDWNELPIPQSLAKLATKKFGKINYHFFLAVKIDNRWLNLDPTWDKSLCPPLPLSTWDGKSDAVIAVPAKSIRVYKKKFKFENRLKSGEFAIIFNNWLAQTRRQYER